MSKKYRRWTKEEDEFLKYAFNKEMSLKEMEEGLDDRTQCAIKSRITHIGLRRNNPPREKDGLLRCSRCKEYLPKEEFIRMSDGTYYYYCNACKTLINKEKYLQKKKEEMQEKANKVFKDKIAVNDGKNTKVCTRCGIEKNVDEFYWETKGKKLASICSTCKKELNAQYKEKSLRTRGF